MTQRPRHSDASSPPSADEVEQRRRADGTFEEPDELEELDDAPLTADMIEQRQVVEYDEEDERPAE